MRKRHLIFLCSLFSIVSYSQSLVDPLTPTNALPLGISTSIGWTLNFSDEFNGTTLNTTKWNVDNINYSRIAMPSINVMYWYWKTQNTTVNNGNLVMTAVKQGDSTMYCGSINSDKKYTNQYGFYEASFKIGDPNKGVNSAFWLMGSNVANVDGTGNDGAEIDIFEATWTTNKAQSSIHIDGYGAYHQANPIQYTTPNLFIGYHTWGLWWTATFLRIYYDGSLVAQYYDTKWIPWVPERIILSLTPGWGLSGKQYFTNQPLGLLTQAYVDYVRVWKQNTTAITPVNDDNQKKLHVEVIGNKVQIDASSVITLLNVYDIAGKVVAQFSPNANSYRTYLKKGIYIAEAKFAEGGEFCRKKFVVY